VPEHGFGPNTPGRVATVERVPTFGKLSKMQLACAMLLGLGKSYREIGEALHITESTVKYYIDIAASKIPGDLPSKARVVAWVRGASLDVLEGKSLTHEVVRLSRGRSPLLAVAEAAANH
jgi:DNA-binding CsgD family transcriptional regulator